MKGLNLDSPLDIPERKNGKFKIKRDVVRKGSKLTVVSIRNAILMGVRPCEVVLDKDRVVHKLYKDGQLMFSDSPQEIFLLNRGVKRASGRVLIGGLGLGYIASKVIVKPKVKSVVAVELEKVIIGMVKPYISREIRVIHDDLYNYLKSGKAEFDYAYFDIWYGTGEMVWEENVLPLRRLVWKLYGRKRIDCWGEQEMETQVATSLGNIFLRRPELKSICYTPVFYVFAKKVYKLPKVKDVNDIVVRYFINLFLRDIGSPRWEKVWRWEELSKECKKLYKEVG